jgi:holin-like protein
MLNTFATLLVFQTMGEGLAYSLSLPIPGPVIGMLLLFLYLLLKSDAVHSLAPTSLALLRHLSLLFVPAGVGIMVHAQRLAAEWLPITVALVVSTAVCIAVTALVVRALQKVPMDEAAAEVQPPVEAGNPPPGQSG